MDSETFNRNLKIESWTLFGAGCIVFIARMVSRRMKLGAWNKLAVEDYLMLFALINFTGVAYSINEVAANGSSYLPSDVANNLTPSEKDAAIYGSIMTFVLEIFTITALWTIKVCLLLLYARLTKSALSREYIVVKIVGAFVVFSYFLVIFLFIFYWCSPNVQEYWRVPYKYEQCATYYHHLIFATAFNIASDLMLFFIPIPIIIRTRLPMKRKIILCFILGLGVFNILASILNRYYNFAFENQYIFLFWYVAEVGVAMFVGNLPLCYPLLRYMLGQSKGSSHSTPLYVITIGSERMRKRRAPQDTLLNSTRGGVTQWDKLEEQGPASTGGEAVTERTGTISNQGSQTELVLQGHGRNHHHETTVSSNGNESDDAQQIDDGRSSQTARPSADKIMVVRTVDISSQGGR